MMSMRSHARWMAGSRESHPQPRPAGRVLCPIRPCQRHLRIRKLSAEIRDGCQSKASLGSRRLADCRLVDSRTGQPHQPVVPVEDLRQPSTKRGSHGSDAGSGPRLAGASARPVVDGDGAGNHCDSVRLRVARRSGSESSGVPSGIDLAPRRQVDRNEPARAALIFIFLPYDAFICADAIIRTGVRTLWTRRKMLEWKTASDAESELTDDLESSFRRMWFSPAFALVIALGLAFVQPVSLWVASRSSCSGRLRAHRTENQSADSSTL